MKAAGRRRRRRRLPRQLKTTREGKLLIAITLGLGFGAINSGNNLLYLILGMLLSLIVLSGVLSELTLRRIVVRRRYSGAVHAGRQTFLPLEVTNGKGRLSSFSVEVEELLEPGVAKQRPAYALMLKAGETQTLAIRAAFERRGLHLCPGLVVATRFPFSFFRKSRDVLQPEEVLVYPAVHEVSAPHLGTLDTGILESSRRVGQGEEYHGLREHQLEHDPRDIHWKTSARLGRLVSREYERAADRRIWILVPNAAPGESDEDLEAVEHAIREAASLAVHYNSSGWSVGLRTLDGRVDPAAGTSQLPALLGHLARAPVHRDGTLASLQVPGREGARLMVQHRRQRRLSVQGRYDHLVEVSDEL